MKLMFILSKENIKLASLEVLSLVKVKEYNLNKNILVLDSKFKDYSRLAFTRKIVKFLFSCHIDEIEDYLNKQDWQKYCSSSFALRASGFDEKKLAQFVWNNLKDPKVDLVNPGMQVEIFKLDNIVYCGILLHENKEKFSKRKPFSRPGFHPSGLDPKLARALVNLSGIQLGSTIYDPFCGTGGILIEAALMGLKIIGSDLDKQMVNKCIANLNHYNIKNYKIFQKNALEIEKFYDAIVTDPPYGRSSSTFSIDVEELYSKFLKKIELIIKPDQRMIFVTPKTKNFSTNLKIIDTIDYYVHHILTRRIYIFEKN